VPIPQANALPTALRQQLASLERYCTAPYIASRTGPPMAATTFRGHKRNLL
jgi:hypothetical protein